MDIARVRCSAFARPAIILTSVVLSVAVFSLAMNSPLSHDEHMYVTAGVLGQNNRLYADFAYLQMPYLPMLYSAVYQLTGTSHYLLWARILAALFTICSALLIYLICYHLSNSFFVSISCLGLFVSNPIVIYITPYAWNQAPPLTFTLVAFFLFIIGVGETGIRISVLFLSGVCIAFAIGFKLTYAALPFPFVLLSFLYPRSEKLKTRLRNVVSPVLAGAALGSAPVAFIVARSSWRAFYFNNVGYHLANATWRASQGWSTAVSMLAKVEYGWRMLADSSNAFIAVMLLLVFSVILKQSRDGETRMRELLRIELVLPAVLFFIAVLSAFGPRPLFPQYFATPIAFGIILFCSCYQRIPVESRDTVRALVGCVLIVAGLSGGPRLFKHVHSICRTQAWTPIVVHRAAKNVRTQLNGIEAQGKVATLSPLYAVEAGLPIYKELSTGPFFYRVGDQMSEEERRAYVGTSASALEGLFDRDPPAGILVGFEGDLEQQFIRYAEEQGYAKITGDFGGGTLYLRTHVDGEPVPEKEGT